ncbi:hypothetical protein [Streptomyces sp. NPDC008125]|uniref:hypothetical protein n=1 Tax=Streptomyces sp. NPDC008125 TaxID=3364811 RepID=UPI0036E834D5
MDTEATEPPGRAAGVRLAAAFNAAADEALDPSATELERAVMITGLLKAVESRQKELAAARREDMRVLRRSKTLAVLGEEVGLSTGRVDQIVKGK